MKTLTKVLIPGLAIGLIGVAAHAKGPKADLNQDGKVTHSEFITEAQLKFETADLDQDGYLSEAEREQARANRMEARQTKRFEHLDGNGDGTVSSDEFAAHSEMRRERRGDREGRRGPKPDGARGGADRRRPGGSPEERLAEVDINGDGLISYQEHMDKAETFFTMLDVDQNGVLEKGEGPRRPGPRGGRG